MSKKDELIKKRDSLQKERNELNNKRVSKNSLYLYVWGIALTASVASVLFLEIAPVLIYLFSFLFTFGVPCIYFVKNILKDNKLKDEIAVLDENIINIEKEESKKEMNSRELKPFISKNIDSKIISLDVVNDRLSKMNSLETKTFDSCYLPSETAQEDGPKLSLRK